MDAEDDSKKDTKSPLEGKQTEEDLLKIEKEKLAKLKMKLGGMVARRKKSNKLESSNMNKWVVEAKHEHKKNVFFKKMGPDPLFSLEEMKLIEWFVTNLYTKMEIYQELNILRKNNNEPTICYSTFLDFEKKFPEYFEQKDDWKARASDNIEKALARSAIGMTIREEKALVVGDGEGTSHVEIHSIKKQLAPNVQALKFWLTNKKPHEWKERNEVVVDGLKNMTDEELEILVAQQLQKNEGKDENKV